LELLASDPEPDGAEVRDSAARMRRTVVNAKGLSVVRAIAKAHDGHLDLKAPLEGGLDVRVTFPLS
jgi:signal transduction histidine kinase